jgi:site-specific DNA-methyltransferase (adenine-specific)
MFVFSKGIPKTFNPILEKKLWMVTGYQKAKRYQREKNGIAKFSKSNIPTKKTKIAGNIWYYSVGGGHVTKDTIAYQHPAIFPESLARDHMQSWSNPGDLIYDPMAGSGTVIKIAIIHKRNWIASEISKKYCIVIEERIKIAKRLSHNLELIKI